MTKTVVLTIPSWAIVVSSTGHPALRSTTTASAAATIAAVNATNALPIGGVAYSTSSLAPEGSADTKRDAMSTIRCKPTPPPSRRTHVVGPTTQLAVQYRPLSTLGETAESTH